MKIKLSFLLSLVLSTCSMAQNLECYALKYGVSQFPPPEENLTKADDMATNYGWLFYAIRYGEKIILVDTGASDKELIRKYKIRFTDPLLILGQLGINPGQVTDVILTHAHFDHIGNVEKFKNARILIQKNELKQFLTDQPDSAQAGFLRHNKNLVTFRKHCTLYRKFIIQKIGKHTIGSSIVRFQHENTEYIISGDEYIENPNPAGLKHHSNGAKFPDESDWRLLTAHDYQLVSPSTNIAEIIGN